MAKVVITLEDVRLASGETAFSYFIETTLTPEDQTLPPEAVVPSVGVSYAIRSMLRDGSLSDFARDNIDALVEEAAIEVALAEKAAQNTAAAEVNNNIGSAES